MNDRLVVYAILSAVSLLLAQALILWLAARLCGIRKAGIRRLLPACFSVDAIAAAAGIALLEIAPAAFAPVLAAALLAAFLAAFLVLWGILQAPPARAALAGTVFIALSALCAAPLAYLVLFESYQIPTGSGAPVILGDHTVLACGSCGLMVPVGIPHEDVGFRRPPIRAAACPNCRSEIPFPEEFTIVGGDRVQIARLLRSRRWELIAFRSPEDPDRNYIFRLAGLPGETIELHDGDLFANGKRVSKPPGTAEEMWIPVHDTALRPRTVTPKTPRWRPAAEPSRRQEQAAGWSFSGIDAAEERLEFDGPITDELAFNAYWSAMEAPLLAGDVRVEGEIVRFEGDGRLGILWERGGLAARAVISPDGEVALEADGASVRARLSGPPAAGMRLALAIRDGWAHALADGRAVASLALVPQGIEEARRRGPDAGAPARVAILAVRCDLHLTRIAIHRDVHYRVPDRRSYTGRFSGQGLAAGRLALGAGEHFVLGDNSAAAYDSRYWGAVPAGDILGPVWWVFWPPQRWRAFR